MVIFRFIHLHLISRAGMLCFYYKKIKTFQPNGNIAVIQQNWMKRERTNQCTVAFKLSHCFFYFCILLFSLHVKRVLCLPCDLLCRFFFIRSLFLNRLFCDRCLLIFNITSTPVVSKILYFIS